MSTYSYTLAILIDSSSLPPERKEPIRVNLATFPHYKAARIAAQDYNTFINPTTKIAVFNEIGHHVYMLPPTPEKRLETFSLSSSSSLLPEQYMEINPIPYE